MRNRGRTVGLAAAVAVAVVATAGLSLAAPGRGNGHAYGRTRHQAGSGTRSVPPGNNGTVKIDGQPLDQGTDNESHPGCSVSIDFFGYDQGDLQATYDLSLQPPSGRGELAAGSVFIGGDPAGGGGDFDGTTGLIDPTQALASSGATANPNQGYHVFLTVHAQGSIGSDVKHKVFWIGCDTSSAGGGSGLPVRSARPDTQAGSAAAAARPATARQGRVAAARPARPVSTMPGFTG